MTKPWVFMGGDRSHFTGKLRPAVRYKQIHTTERPPDGTEIMRRTGIMFVPVLITPADETLQDTTMIIDALEERVPDPPLLPTHPLDLALCRLFELYGDEFFLMVDMRTRWGYPDNDVRQGFSAFAGSVERGDAIADRMSGYLPQLGITDATIPAIDAHFADMLAALKAHFAEHRFLLGDRLSLADCALMGGFYGHLYMDRVTRKMLYDDAMEVCFWIERCNRPVPEEMGEWFDGDYPPTLTRVLELIGMDAGPMLAALGSAFDTWARTNAVPGMEPERYVGEYRTTLRGVDVTAGIRSFVAWKLQRLRETAHGEAADAIRAAFATWGCQGLLSSGAVELAKKDYRLIVANPSTP